MGPASDQHRRPAAAARPPARGAPLRVSLLDGSELVTTGFASMLVPHADRVRIVEQPHPGTDLVACDLLLVDFALLPPALVEDLLQRARTAGRVVSYSWSPRPPSGPWWSAARGRVAAHLTKSLPAAELIDRLEAVHHGGTGDEVRVVGPDRRATAGAGPRGTGTLTPREQDIVSRIGRGMSNAEIADQLFLSINSVKTYVRTAYRKMGVTSRSQAVAWWFAGGRGDDRTVRPSTVRPSTARASS